MFSFVLGVLCLLAFLALLVWGKRFVPASWIQVLVCGILLLMSVLFVVFSTSLWVDANSGGLITKKFGNSLTEGHIIAVNGERGAQAEILSPGWSFGWAPWQYDLKSVPNIEIKEGNVGIVSAMDGQPLPEGEIYAPEWKSPTDMIDAKTFMTKGGCKGPQLTVLSPGQYRYNPKLFTIDIKPCVDVKIGEVSVVRANAGKVYTATNGLVVNGVPLVPKGYRGIWNVALMPGKYYMHPNAYQVVPVKTTKRVFSYTGKGSQEGQSKSDRPHLDNSIPTRSADGFNIPVEVRVTACISAEDAPYVVAKLGDPDAISSDGFETMETVCILPSIRAILRNSAQGEGALQFVQKRSEVEADTYNKFKADMIQDKIDVEAVYLAHIGLDATPEGQALLKTQTDKQIAEQQQAMYQQQVLAENQRALQVKAGAAADQQKRIQESLANIEFEKNGAEAARNKATGESAQSLVYEAKVKALGGVENFTRLEIAKIWAEALGKAWKGEVPTTVFMGGQGSMLDSVMTGVFSQQLKGPVSQPAK